MTRTIKLFLLLAGLMIDVWFADACVEWLNAPSDGKVFFGILGLVAACTLAVVIVATMVLTMFFAKPRATTPPPVRTKSPNGTVPAGGGGRSDTRDARGLTQQDIDATKNVDPGTGRAAAAVLLIAALVLPTAGCWTVIEPGHVGVVVHNTGSDRGVQDFPVTTGRVFYNPFQTSVLEYTTSVQTAQWTANLNEGNKGVNEEISFPSKEGVQFSADISFSHQLQANKVPAFYVKFRTDDIDVYTNGFLHNVARDAFTEITPAYSTEELYSTAIPEVLAKVRARINAAILPFGDTLIQLGFIGSPHPRDSAITKSISAKVQAAQLALTAENQVAIKKAEAQQAIAKAEGEAKANQVLSSSLTPALLQWRQLDIQEKSMLKWNGALPTMMTPEGALPFIQVPSPGKK